MKAVVQQIGIKKNFMPFPAPLCRVRNYVE
jgi:hypothetical protein